MSEVCMLATLHLVAAEGQFSLVVTDSRRHSASFVPSVSLCWNFTVLLLQLRYSYGDSYRVFLFY